MRPEERAGRGVGELRADPEIVTRPQEGARDDHVDVGFGRNRPRVQHLGREARCRQTGPDHERLETGELCRKGIRQAEREEVGFGIWAGGAQNAITNDFRHVGYRSPL